jgi:DNA replication protein DnaC
MLDKLAALRLRGMVEAFKEQTEDPQSHRLSFEERLGLMVDRQWNWKQNRALDRRLRNARLQGNACVEDIEFRPARGLERQKVRSLTAESAWVRDHLNLLFTGPTGTGKSYMARADGSLSKLLYRLGRVDVLIVDDWAMAPLADPERRDFLEICDERYQARSTLLTSQLPVSAWHAQIGEPTVADSILDRLVHNAHRIELQGDSMRKKRPAKPSAES